MSNQHRNPLELGTSHPGAAPSCYERHPSRRSNVLGTRGVVACSQPLAASAGIKVLEAGGNAADAAVATAAALNVTEPSSTGIGGDVFCLFYSAKHKTVRALNGSGRSPQYLTLDRLLTLGNEWNDRIAIPERSVHAVTVPGAAAAWYDVVHIFGSGQVGFEQVLAPAINLAERGFPVSEISANMWQSNEKLLLGQSPNGGELLRDGKRAPRAGERIRLPQLAQTFRLLGENGKAGFYSGRVAESIVQSVQSLGGWLTMDDLADHAARPPDLVDPISYHYRPHPESVGVDLVEHPPNGQGLTALIALGLIDAMQAEGLVPDLSTVQHNSAVWLHAVIEALRLAFADVRHFVRDPQFGHVPVNKLLSKSYLTQRVRQHFDPNKATADIQQGSPEDTCDTVYLTVTDEEGNACSFINSTFTGFGSGIVAKGTGVALQNRGAGFMLEPGHLNSLEPRKRPYHTIIPAMVLRDNELFFSYGVMGGYMQPQGHLQVLLNILHAQHSPQQALDSARICIGPGVPRSKTKPADGRVFVEDTLPQTVTDTLRQMGHQIIPLSGFQRSMFGRGQVIMRLHASDLVPEDPSSSSSSSSSHSEDQELIWAAGSDPRGDGQAIAQI